MDGAEAYKPLPYHCVQVDAIRTNVQEGVSVVAKLFQCVNESETTDSADLGSSSSYSHELLASRIDDQTR